MSTQEAATYLGMSRTTLWRYIKRGAIAADAVEHPAHTSRVYRLLRSDVDAAKARLDAGQPLITPNPGRKPRSH